MKSYTVVFIFNKDLSRILLILKNRPKWQEGKFNGVGGKIEEGETSLECAIREVKEEVNLDISDLTKFATLIENGILIDFYYSIYEHSENDAKSLTDEMSSWHNTNNLPKNMIHNTSWLIPLAIDRFHNDNLNIVTAVYD